MRYTMFRLVGIEVFLRLVGDDEGILTFVFSGHDGRRSQLVECIAFRDFN